jgi:hypothetical protein
MEPFPIPTLILLILCEVLRHSPDTVRSTCIMGPDRVLITSRIIRVTSLAYLTVREWMTAFRLSGRNE